MKVTDSMDITILLTALSLVSVIAGLGWKVSQYLADIRIMVAEIRALLAHTSARLDRIEVEYKSLETRVRNLENNEQ